ncbi:MAG: zinc ribbon domain-containing protein [Candidatus Riflebacteria bacterium]|nr:zinc ribbon domain-containing protein [Candidatus Riflebacteria bacterium]
MRICATCTLENDDESRFCERCGTSLDAAVAGSGMAPGQRDCPSCQWKVTTLSPFCTHCGHKMPAPQPQAGAVTPTCPSCSAAVAVADFFCGWCGGRLAPPGSEEAAATTPSDLDSTLRPGEGAHLVVLAGREKDKVYWLSSSGMRLGRAKDNDVCLDTDGYVSNAHARVFVQGGEYFVEDAGSVNGTFLKLRRPWRLQPGDEVKIGQSLFRFSPASKNP